MEKDSFVSQSTEKAKELYKEHQKLLKQLQKKRPKDLDYKFQDAHEEVFDEIDCLDCANCCKTTSPIFKDKDIVRIAKSFRMKPGAFIDNYLRRDEDDDYVLQQSPCFFLNEDNTCAIYDIRPNACREYPHTDRKKIYQLMPLTLKNTVVCPATLRIVEKIKSHYS